MEGKYGLRLSTFDLFKGFKPADQAHEFCISHCLSEGHRNVIFAKLCEVVGCARGELLIWRKWVEVSVRAVGLEVKEGGELADAIFQVLQPLGVPFLDLRKLMDAAKSDGIPCTRDYGLAFSRTMRMENIYFQYDLRIYYDRNYTVNGIYHFALMNSSVGHFELMSVLVLPHICEVLPCQRLVPLVFTKVFSDKSGTALGRLDILCDEETIDVINRFIQAYGLAAVYVDEASLYR